MNLEHVGIYAQDSAKLARWYRDVLELRVIREIVKEGRPPIVFLQGAAGVVIEILPTSAAPVERNVSCPGYTHLGIDVKDFDAEKVRLSALGIDLWGVRETSNGWTIGYFKDPEGNILELIQR